MVRPSLSRAAETVADGTLAGRRYDGPPCDPYGASDQDTLLSFFAFISLTLGLRVRVSAPFATYRFPLFITPGLTALYGVSLCRATES